MTLLLFSAFNRLLLTDHFGLGRALRSGGFFSSGCSSDSEDSQLTIPTKCDTRGELHITEMHRITHVEGADINANELWKILWQTLHFDAVKQKLQSATVSLDSNGFAVRFNRHMGMQFFISGHSVKINVQDRGAHRVVLDLLEKGQLAGGLASVIDLQLNQHLFTSGVLESFHHFTRAKLQV